MKAKPVNNIKDLGIETRKFFQSRLNYLLLPLDLDMSVEIVEDYKGHKDLTVMRIIRYGHPVEIINVTGNSNEAIFKDFCRYIADGEKCIGYVGKER